MTMDVKNFRIYNRALSTNEVAELYAYESPPPQPPQSFLTNGLVAYYPFNGNANDASGNGNNGIVYGATLTTDRFGNTNAAYYFNGTSAYITAPLTNTIFNGDFTASVWVNASNVTHGWPTFLDEQNGGFRLQLAGDDCGCSEPEHLVSYSGGPSGRNWLVWSSQITPVNTWQQVIVTKAGINVTMYVNGQVADTNQVANSTTPSGGYLSVGVQYDLASGSFFSGVIDDIRIYNRALSASEVQQLYAYESTPPTSTPPSITSQPQSVTVNAKASATFTVTAAGTAPLEYQWEFDGTNILGATSSSLTISNVVQTNLGAYSVVVSNAVGSVTNSSATLSMYPFIAAPFTGLDTFWGFTNTLSVAAWGTGPLTYQWLDNGVAIANATNQTLTLSDIQFTNAGLYSVVVSSPLGGVTNTPAQVVVNPANVSLGLFPGVYIGGVVGNNYIIQSNPNLTNTNGWTSVATVTLVEPVQLWVDINVNTTSPTNQQHFYRVLPGP